MARNINIFRRSQKMKAKYPAPTYARSKYGENSYRQEEMELVLYGKVYSRTIMRSAIPSGVTAYIPYRQAVFELSGLNTIYSKNTEFAEFNGQSVQVAVRKDDMFFCPWFAAAIAELFDAGCSILTSKAVYALHNRQVDTEETEKVRTYLQKKADADREHHKVISRLAQRHQGR